MDLKACTTCVPEAFCSDVCEVAYREFERMEMDEQWTEAAAEQEALRYGAAVLEEACFVSWYGMDLD